MGSNNNEFPDLKAENTPNKMVDLIGFLVFIRFIS